MLFRSTLVYDRNVSKFVSLDMQDDLAQIKQYADIIVNGERRLFFITTDDKFYEAWASDEIAPAKLTIGEWCSNDPRIEQSPLFLHAVFTECEQEGTVTVTPIVNRVHYSPKTETLKALATPKTLPISTPFGGGTRNTTQVVTFNLSGTVSAGWKLGFEISWNVKARLTHVSLDAEQNKQDTNSQAKARRYAAGAS